MNNFTKTDKTPYKNETAYKVTTIIVPVLAVILIFLLIWYSRGSMQIKEPRTITLYCFSAMESVMEQSIIPAFQQRWLKKHQERVEFITTFAGSGVITRQIMTRFPAEVAILSSELDARRLVSEGILSAASWQDLQKKEKFCESPIVLFARNSMPQTLTSFEELNPDTLDVIIPDPLTSGEGQMAVLAIYGSQLMLGTQEDAALAYVKSWLAKTRHHPSTSQDAMEQFHAGMGDVLFHFEAARDQHVDASPIRVIYPRRTMMTEPVAVAVQKNITANQAEIVDAFLAFLWSEQAQNLLIKHGFRSQILPASGEDESGQTDSFFTMDSLGSASDLIRNIIDPLLAREN
ncbi:MAG: substrate-binding domain-containing protein [Candidatus Marinimicrobia bacterium]|nr:substrate-binding domain-containing protein [Candidatus Neomarinimicrobiota bacterium]